VFRRLLENHILVNLSFLLVLAMGWISYTQMPREQDPTINFSWVQIWTYWPGAAASDVEQRITDPLEKGVEKIDDIRFVSSTSREGLSSILVRFRQLDEDTLTARIADLRRELEARRDELPPEVEQPEIVEISSANAYPTATLVAWSERDDEELQRLARNFREDLERLPGVDSVSAAGARDAELQVNFHPERLLGLGLSPADLADTVSVYFRDLAAGDIALGDQNWLVRLSGTSSDVGYLESLPISTPRGEVPLRSVSHIEQGREDPRDLVRYRGKPAVLLSVFKAPDAGTLSLLESVTRYVEDSNASGIGTGVELVLLDDQTLATRAAIGVMESNALIGLLLVMAMTWLFLGAKMAMFTSVGIPLVLAGVFWVLALTGQTLNLSVLLGIVICLGMLVDDVVVVVEAIAHHIRRGLHAGDAVLQALREVALPVTTAVLTTIAAFLPMMLLPGLLGDFMRVIPIVVTVALLISLVEAFWMLPAHVIEFRPELDRPGFGDATRQRLTRRLRTGYGRVLAWTLRRPRQCLAMVVGLLVVAGLLVALGLVRVNFFAAEAWRLFYVNVDMPPGTSLQKTSDTLVEMETLIRGALLPGEEMGIVNYAGQQFNDNELLIGDDKGQIFVSLDPVSVDSRSVDEVIDAVRGVLAGVPGPVNVAFKRRQTGPPTAAPISVKVRGDDVEQIRGAVAELERLIQAIPGTRDISNDDARGGMEMTVQLNADAITRSGLSPATVFRAVGLYADGEIVASMQHEGEELDVRVRVEPRRLQDTESFLGYSLGLPGGGEMALGELLTHQKQPTSGNIRHFNFRRAVTIEGDLDTAVTDTLAVNADIRAAWDGIADQYPGISLDFTGQMDDIQEGLAGMATLGLLAVGLIFLIMGTQFRSYLQPLIVLATIPLALIGVVFGLFVSNNPVSMYTLYGAIALAGIAANDAIVLLSTANRNREQGMPVAVAAFRAARRRVVPVTITSLTTMAGLFSLAVGLGGKSLMWGPVATVIVWGLGCSTALTLLVIPILYSLLVKPLPEVDLIFSAFLPPLEPVAALPPQAAAPAQPRSLPAPRPPRAPSKHTEHTTALRQVLENPRYRRLYQTGIDALRDGNSGLAARNLRYLAELAPEVMAFNVYAAQALIEHMTTEGWNAETYSTAQRYLARARTIDASDAQLANLEQLMTGDQDPG
jgi:multidrug efflux pump subunit AcrB